MRVVQPPGGGEVGEGNTYVTWIELNIGMFYQIHSEIKMRSLKGKKLSLKPNDGVFWNRL
jgi:hypothetical protein